MGKINTIFLDMDGVICDFRKKCESLNCINGYKVNWKVVHSEGAKFWESIEWIPGGKEFYEWLTKLCDQEEIELYILSAVNYPEGKIGKLNWLKSNTKIDRHHIVIVNTGNEKAYYAANDALLIDDFGKNCKAFGDADGLYIKHENFDDTQGKILEILGT